MPAPPQLIGPTDRMLPAHNASSSPLLQPFFEALLARDASGRSWLPALLRATPHGPSRLGDLLESPGTLQTPLAVRGVSGRLACFEYPAAPSRELLRWLIDHPDRLTWPPVAELSREASRLRRALLYDDPPGAQTRAGERARELLATRTSLSPEWWRLEGIGRLDCALITDRLVITIEGQSAGPLSPPTDWYPERSRLVRNLEAARQLSEGKRWASLLLSDEPLAEGSDEHLESVLARSAPHLDSAARMQLREGYLGNLAWSAAFAAVDVQFPAPART